MEFRSCHGGRSAIRRSSRVRLGRMRENWTDMGDAGERCWLKPQNCPTLRSGRNQTPNASHRNKPRGGVRTPIRACPGERASSTKRNRPEPISRQTITAREPIPHANGWKRLAPLPFRRGGFFIGIELRSRGTLDTYGKTPQAGSLSLHMR